jgi:hypothetical protein
VGVRNKRRPLYTGNVPSNASSAFDWNVSLPQQHQLGYGTAGQGSIPLIAPSKMMLLPQGEFGGTQVTSQ